MDACITSFQGYDVCGHELLEDGSSWVVVIREYHPADDDAFEEAWSVRPAERPQGSVMGRAVAFPRRTRAYGKDYSFAGQTAASSSLHTIPSLSRSYREKTRLVESAKLNGVLINWYDAKDGDYIGPHSDNEKDLAEEAPILSITWAKPDAHFRRFRLTPKRKSKGQTVVLSLYNGDLVVMGGKCQKTHKHEIMKARTRQEHECTGRRINQTDRRFL